jgi:hypothetical protein
MPISLTNKFLKNDTISIKGSKFLFKVTTYYKTKTGEQKK